jgi:putative membrane protein
MLHAPYRKTALSVALLSLGLAMSAMAQTPSKQANTPATHAPSANAPAMSTDTSAPRGASDAKLSHGDKKFMEEAAKGGMAEVQLGQLAAQKAGSEDVKKFGQKMADDHAKANDELKKLASSKGVELPTDLDRSAKREHDKLSKMSGADFDREYMKHMVDDHKKDVKDFQKEAKSAKDPDVKSFASSTLPTLEQHLQLAQRTDAEVRTASRGGNTMHTNATNTSNTPPASGTAQKKAY